MSDQGGGRAIMRRYNKPISFTHIRLINGRKVVQKVVVPFRNVEEPDRLDTAGIGTDQEILPPEIKT